MRHAAVFSTTGASQKLRLALSAKRVDAGAQDESVITLDCNLCPRCSLAQLIHPTRRDACAPGNLLRCQRPAIVARQQAACPRWESVELGEKRAHLKLSQPTLSNSDPNVDFSFGLRFDCLPFGLPPFLPFSRTARRFAGLLDNPPIRPRTLAAFFTDGGTGIALAKLNLSELVVNN